MLRKAVDGAQACYFQSLESAYFSREKQTEVCPSVCTRSSQLLKPNVLLKSFHPLQSYWSSTAVRTLGSFCSIPLRYQHTSHTSVFVKDYAALNNAQNEMCCYNWDRLSSCSGLKGPLKTKRMIAEASRVVKSPKFVSLIKSSCKFLIIAKGPAAAAKCLLYLKTPNQASHNWPGSNCTLCLDTEVAHCYIQKYTYIKGHREECLRIKTYFRVAQHSSWKGV